MRSPFGDTSLPETTVKPGPEKGTEVLLVVLSLRTLLKLKVGVRGVGVGLLGFEELK